MRAAIGTLFLLLLVAGSPVRAEECTGLTVATIEYVGCDVGRCAGAPTQQRLDSVTGLLGTTWSAEALERARTRLLKSRYFMTVQARCVRLTPLDGKVVFTVEPNRYVRNVEVNGTKILFKSELEKRLFMHSGAIFNPEDKESRERLERQVANLVSYMRQEGFDGAGIETHVTLVEPDLVDVVLQVNEGKVSRIEKVDVTLDGPWDDDVPSQYACPLVKQRDLVQVTKVRRGDLLTGRTLRTVKRRVREFLQQYGFQAPRIKVVYDPDSEALQVAVRLSKCFSIRVLEREEAQGYEEGYEGIDTPEVLAALPFRESGVFDLREAQLGVEELLVYYKTRGYLFADITMQYVDYREMNPGYPYPLLGGVTYRVTRGQPSEIREIRFVGLDQVKAEELLELMDTRRYDFFDVGGYLQIEQLFGDLDVVKKYFLDRGLFRMTYPRARNTEAQVRVTMHRKDDSTVYRYDYLDKSFDVIKPDWENAIRIEIAIDEGGQSRVRKLQLEGVSALPQAKLYKELPLRAGGDFSPKLVRASVLTIERRYQQLGRNVEVTVECEAEGPSVPLSECDVASVTSRRVDLFLRIREGEERIMGKVLTVGNLKTRRGVISRDFPDEGDPYDKSRVDAAIRRLRNLGVFSAVRVTTIGPDEDPPRRRVDVVVQVEEAGTRSLELSAGFQKMYDRSDRGDQEPMSDGFRDVLATSLHNTGSPLTGSASMQTISLPDVLLLGEVAYTDRNFLGFGKSVQVPVSYGLTTKDPARYAAFRPTYYDMRFLSTDINMRLMPLVIYDRALSRVDKFEYGLENELSYQVWRGIHLSLTNRVTRTAWKYPWEPEFSPMEWEVSVAPGIRFDFRDNPIHPTSGFYLMGRIKYLNAYEIVREETEDGDQYANERENFFQYELQGQGYLSIRKTLILALNARYGHTYTVEGDRNGRLPPTHLFYLGGTTGVRGFPARGILQYDRAGFPRLEKDPTSDADEWRVIEGGGTMVNASAELRFPILRPLGLWGATFLDMGAVTPDLGSALHSRSLRFSTGLGLRWLIGDQIPVRLDYGFVLDPRCNQVDPLTKECVGTDDRGGLDFGLLYTF